MWRVWVRRGGCIGSWWGNRREIDHWRDLGVDEWIILGWIFSRWDVGIWIGLGWPRIYFFSHLNAQLNPTCHLLALLGAHHILHVSKARVKERW